MWAFLSEGLNPKFLVRESFYLANFYELIDETLWQEGEWWCLSSFCTLYRLSDSIRITC